MSNAIFSRDLNQKKHELRVADHPDGATTLVDDQLVRILEPSAAIGLAVELIMAAGPQVMRPDVVGLLSSTF